MLRPQVTRVTLEEPTRRALQWETCFVMVAFLLPVVASAIVVFAQHVTGVGAVTRFPVVVQGHPLENMLIGMLAYLPVACTVPLALLLLRRTGQGPKVLGLELPGLRSDIVPAIGIGLASFGTEIAVLIPLAPILTASSRFNSPTPIGTVPTYYVIWGLMISATTAVAEEVLMNGYLMTRLGQAGLDAAVRLDPWHGAEDELPRLLRARLHRHDPLRLLRHPLVPEERAPDAADRGALPLRCRLDHDRRAPVSPPRPPEPAPQAQLGVIW